MTSFDSLKFAQVSILKSNDQDLMIPCFITKYVNPDVVYFQYECHKDTFVRLCKEIRSYYKSKSVLNYIHNIIDQQTILNSLFIYQHEDDYFRAKVLEVWPGGKYYTQLIDFGFNVLAHQDALFLNDNSEFLQQPIQGFVYSISIGNDLLIENQYKHIVNYVLQKTIMSMKKFFIKFDSYDKKKVHLFFKNQNNKIILISDCIMKILEVCKQSKTLDSADDLDIDEKLDKIIGDFINFHDDSLHQQVIDSSHNHSSPSSIEMKVHALLFDCDAELMMKIKQVISPSRFYLKFVSDSDYLELKQKINQYFTRDTPIIAQNPQVGRMYGVNRNKKWVRVLINHHDTDTKYSCFMIDKGSEEVYDAVELYELSDELRTYPPRSVRGSLDFIKPRNGNKWDIDTIQFFMMEVCNQMVEVYPNDFDHNEYLLHCNLVVNENNVADLLVSKKLAECRYGDS